MQDGWVHIYTSRWERLADWLKLHELHDPKWADRAYQNDHWDEGDQLVQRVLATMTKQQAASEGQATGNPTAPVSTTADFVNSPHIKERGFFTEVDHPALGRIGFPGAPFRISETPWRIRRPAPWLGEHTDEVFAESARPTAVHVRDRAETPMDATTPQFPFKGLRVLDFTIAFVGPFATRYLAELGAEVIKVESNVAIRSKTPFRTVYPGGRGALSMEIN